MAQTEIIKGNKLGVTGLWPLNRLAEKRPLNVGQTERLASVIGGGALTLFGLTRRSPLKLGILALGGNLLYQGLTGRSPIYQVLGIDRIGNDGSVKVEKTMTIGKTPDELYHYWRDFTNLPRFMEHLEAVTVASDTLSHWVAKGPAGTRVEWDAEIIDDKENELISWRSLPGSGVKHEGLVSFTLAPGDRGTQVKVIIDYQPPAGSLGVAVAKFTGEAPSQQIREDLRHFKMLMESDQVITTKGQPSGRSHH